MPELITLAKLSKELETLAGWSGDEKQIEKTFQRKDFKSALDFVNKVGELAEKADHHPDIFLHGWNKVRITLSTHSAGGVTGNDVQLARQIEEIPSADLK